MPTNPASTNPNDAVSAPRPTPSGDLIDTTTLRAFLTAALNHDAAIDPLNDLLHEHVAHGRLHPSVVAASLKPILEDLINTANQEDWQAIADHLITDAHHAHEGSST